MEYKSLILLFFVVLAQDWGCSARPPLRKETQQKAQHQHEHQSTKIEQKAQHRHEHQPTEIQQMAKHRHKHQPTEIQQKTQHRHEHQPTEIQQMAKHRHEHQPTEIQQKAQHRHEHQMTEIQQMTKHHHEHQPTEIQQMAKHIHEHQPTEIQQKAQHRHEHQPTEIQQKAQHHHEHQPKEIQQMAQYRHKREMPKLQQMTQNHNEHQTEDGATGSHENASGQRKSKNLMQHTSQLSPEDDHSKTTSLENMESKQERITDVDAKMTEVAFTARYTGDWVLFEPGTTLVFGTVVTSVGPGYDAGTGIFTCPVSGIYYFVVTAYIRELDGVSGSPSVELVVNGPVMAEVYLYDAGSGENAYVTGSNGATAICAAGQTAYARAGPVPSMIGGTAGIEATQFTGILLSLQ